MGYQSGKRQLRRERVHCMKPTEIFDQINSQIDAQIAQIDIQLTRYQAVKTALIAKQKMINSAVAHVTAQTDIPAGDVAPEVTGG